MLTITCTITVSHYPATDMSVPLSEIYCKHHGTNIACTAARGASPVRPLGTVSRAMSATQTPPNPQAAAKMCYGTITTKNSINMCITTNQTDTKSNSSPNHNHTSVYGIHIQRYSRTFENIQLGVKTTIQTYVSPCIFGNNAKTFKEITVRKSADFSSDRKNDTPLTPAEIERRARNHCYFKNETNCTTIRGIEIHENIRNFFPRTTLFLVNSNCSRGGKSNRVDNHWETQFSNFSQTEQISRLLPDFRLSPQRFLNFRAYLAVPETWTV